MIKAITDSQLLTVLNTSENGSLSRLDVYKACVGLSNIGIYHKAELHLLPEEQQLLYVRKAMHAGQLEKAAKMIDSLRILSLSDFHMGDSLALLGIIRHMEGDIYTGTSYLQQSAEFFRKSENYHRYLRSKINSAIVVSDMNSFIGGELFGLAQLTRREQQWDLLGHIRRGAACEFLVNGKLELAELEIIEAISCYELEGAPEDLSLAYCLKAIILFLSGDIQGAFGSVKRVTIYEGKVASYFQIYSTLIGAKLPILNDGHPLANVDWHNYLKKTSSIPGKIIIALQKKPKKRDQLIAEVWGAGAIDPSYCNRLYSAISNINRSGLLKIVFDGEYYVLVKTQKG